MFKSRFRLPSPALVISMITLSLVLGGTAVAATTAKSKHKDAKADTKLVKHLAPKLSVKHAKTANSANTAKNATNAVNATNATNAVNAGTATNAGTAGNANNLGGQPPSFYMPNSAVQRGTFFLNPGDNKVLFTDGPLFVTADCALSGGVTTVNVHIGSTVGNWIYFGNTLEAAPGNEVNDTLSDNGSVGTFHGGIDRLEAVAPNGNAIHGQDSYGVNYPSAGKCYVSAWVNSL